MNRKFLARLRSERGCTLRDGCTVREVIRDSRDEAQRWIDTEINAEYAAGRYPGRADVIELWGHTSCQHPAVVIEDTNSRPTWIPGTWIRRDSAHAPIATFNRR